MLRELIKLLNSVTVDVDLAGLAENRVDRLRAEELAKTIVGMAPLAIAACLEAVRWGGGLRLEAATDVEAEIFGRLCGTVDKAEGTKAFLEKRAAVWMGR